MQSENFDNLIKIISIYKNEKLNILGTYSHLCVADSSIKEDINFTKKQISCFDKCINFLKENGFDTGIIHLQSSYGAINYSELNYDYIRLGICMYGVNSSYDSYQLNSVNLKPVLSLKARITTIKEINKNDSVSYGRIFISKGKMRIATIAIGYADGIPRNLSNQNLLVEVNGKYFNSIGRICMDQMIIDISNKQNIKVGNVVTLIGADRRISAEKMALKGSTITNELLSRLGSRLNRVIVK